MQGKPDIRLLNDFFILTHLFLWRQIVTNHLRYNNTILNPSNGVVIVLHLLNLKETCLLQLLKNYQLMYVQNSTSLTKELSCSAHCHKNTETYHRNVIESKDRCSLYIVYSVVVVACQLSFLYSKTSLISWFWFMSLSLAMEMSTWIQMCWWVARLWWLGWLQRRRWWGM